MSKGSRAVFVGNIPYDLTETQLIDIFSEVGTVVNFRLVFDRETGKTKGFGFCTYQDAETAASAVRNLNNYDCGGRQLRVDYADSDDAAPLGTGPGAAGRKDDDQVAMDEYGRQRRRGGPGSGPPPHHQSAGGPRPLQGVTASEAVSQSIATLQPSQLVELMGALKLLLQNNPDQCRTLLIQNPQLAYAIFQALLAMNAVDQFTMQRILQTQTAPTMPIMPPQQAAMPVAMPGMQLLLQVLNLTPDQIRALPPDQQQQIMALRAQVLGPT
ncbi:hypothetical protein BC831DRAFT_472403 [Entophlyctis helioformis]|nr:hypothetical protein BC831DRAFT_472403 [Entophlyctis helioformis]